jgi:hypothetical protein
MADVVTDVPYPDLAYRRIGMGSPQAQWLYA